jgi:uncharacterized protein (DUF983 family)
VPAPASRALVVARSDSGSFRAMDLSVSRVARLFWRAARLRCPNCGGGPLFQSWLRMRAHCPVCGLRLERGEEGYQVGSYMLNIIASESVFLAVFLAVLVLTWPAPPWELLQYGGAALAIAAPFLFFPFTKTLFLAVDLVFRPPTRDELR